MTAPNPYAERPNRFPLPPVIFVSCVVAAYALGSQLPLAVPKDGVLRLVGALGVGAGLALIALSSVVLMRAGTTVLPHLASARLVTTGPFAFSRNPIYLGEALILSGLAFIEGSLWFLVLAITFANLITLLAIVREEAHLRAKFGPAFEAYSAKVRRWI